MNARSARSAIDSRRRRRAAERSRPSFLSARWAPSGSACCAREDFMRKKTSKKRLYAQYMCQYLHWKNQNQSVMSRLRRRHPRKPPERSRPNLDRIDQPGTKNPGASHCTRGAILCVRPDVTLVQFRSGCPVLLRKLGAPNSKMFGARTRAFPFMELPITLCFMDITFEKKRQGSAQSGRASVPEVPYATARADPLTVGGSQVTRHATSGGPNVP